MSRKPRVWFPSATYHITSRGNRRSSLFYDTYDRLTYLKLLEEVREKFPFILHSYCLMTNHIHLQIETVNIHPKEIMKMLQSRYAIYFNKRHKLTGHVFQGRYGAVLILTPHSLLKVSKYIHLNPVEAKIISTAEGYHWSSYASYVSEKGNPNISTEKILSQFSDPKKQNYKEYVEQI